MSFSLPNDIADRIQAQLATGDFTSEEQVLREALDTLEKRQRSLAELRQMVAEAEADVAAGRVGTFDREELVRQVRCDLAARGIVD
jgi:antitoxin ParD1/3/4